MNKLALIVACLLFLAILPLPYTYYSLLRFIVCFVAVLIFFLFIEEESNKQYHWIIIFAVIALLFNPIFPVYLDKSIWVMFDITAGVVFALVGKSKDLLGVKK